MGKEKTSRSFFTIIYHSDIKAMEPLEEIFIKSENIKEEIVDENIASDNNQDEIIEYNINVTEQFEIKTENENIDHDEENMGFLKNEYDIKTEYPSGQDTEAELTKQEDLLDYDDCNTVNEIKNPQKRKISDLFEQANPKKCHVDVDVDVATALH